MRLARYFTLKPNENEQIILGCLTYASARLYNLGNYQRLNWSQDSNQEYPDWYKQKKELKEHFWYKNLASQTAQETLKILSDNWDSFYESIKDYNKNPEKYNGKPHPPYYKPKNSKFNIRYLNNGFKIIDNKLRLSIPKKLKKYLKDKYSIGQKYLWIEIPEFLSSNRILENVKRIEFKPLNNENYKVILTVKVATKEIKKDNNNYLSIDPGINNLMSCYCNKTKESFIIDGGQYLAINRYFAKKIKHYQSILNGQGNKNSKRINNLYSKRKKQLFHLIHSATKKIVNYAVDNDISKVIIGDIKRIRKKANLGKKNNQKLHKWPFNIIFQQLEYKLNKEGIVLIKKKENYTSRCSPYSKKVTKKYSQPANRIKRGLYVDKQRDVAFNSDLVGAYNIMRKYLQQRQKGDNIKLKPEGLNKITKYKWNKQQFVA